MRAVDWLFAFALLLYLGAFARRSQKSRQPLDENPMGRSGTEDNEKTASLQPGRFLP